MSIEVQLTKLIESLDKNTASNNQLFGLLSNASKPAADAPAATPVTKAPTKAEVKAAQKAAGEKKAAEAAAPKQVIGQPVAADEISFDEPEAEAQAEPLTVDDARKALVALQKAKGSAEASRGILKDLNLPSLASLKETDQAKIKAIIDGCNAKMPK